MQPQVFDLTATRHESRVLAGLLATRPGGADRAGLEATQVTRISNAGVVSSDLEGMRQLFQPLPSPGGFAVNDRTAMLVSTVYACLSKISGAILQLPVHQYRVDAQGDRVRADTSNLWWMLNESPHTAWTAASWKEWIVRCVHLRGDQFTRIVRSTNPNAGGAVVGLEPLHPDYVLPRPLPGGGGRLVYDVMDMLTGKADTVDQDDMLHFAGFGFNGVRSVSAIQYAARNAIGNSLAAADFTGRTIGEGAMPQMAISYPGAMKPEQAKLLRDSFVATYTGPGARKLPLVLTENAVVKELSISPVDLELLGLRQYEKEDICQTMGVPPVLIGDNAKTSSWGTGIEQITLGFVKYTIKPHLCRWEEEMNRKLQRRAGTFLEFELDGLLRGDSKAQAEAFRSALGGPGTGDGYMTVNEVRKLKNLPPIDGGSVLYKALTKPLTSPSTGDDAKPTDKAPA